VWNRPDLKTVLFMLFLLGTFGLNFPIFISTMAVGAYHAGAGQYGVLSSAMAVGSVAGALFTASRAQPHIARLVNSPALFGLGCALAARILPAGCFQSSPEAFHLWIRRPEGWGRTEFAAQMKSSGIGVVAGDAFLVGGEPPDAVRICIGGVATREELQHALQLIADSLMRPPVSMPAVV
jgi:hypothetical protein